MYVIHEVDEDTFSERSSRPDKSQLLTQSIHRQSSANHDDHTLLVLKEENEDEDVYGLNNLGNHQTISIENDFSNMQINASQEITPDLTLVNARASNEYQNTNKDHIRIEGD